MLRISLTALSILVFAATCGVVDAAVGITSWYHAELWRFPDPAQDPENLPAAPDAIAYEQDVHSDTTSQPFDLVFEGNAPRGVSSWISTRVAANSDFTHLRAAFETTVANFRADNFVPGYYKVGDDVLPDYGDWNGQTQVVTLIDDELTISGPGPAAFDLTYVLQVTGSNTSNMASSSGSFGGWLDPTTSGVITAYGAETYGPYFELPRNESLDQTVLLTVQANNGATTFTRLAMNFSTNVMGYFPNLSEEQYPDTFLDGSFLWNYETTASIERLIVTVPTGANPADYTFTAASGTPYPVEFRAGPLNSVPEPGTWAVFSTGFAGLAAVGLRRQRRPLANRTSA